MHHKSKKIDLYKIFSRLQDDIYFYCLSVLGNSSDAEKATALVFETADTNDYSLDKNIIQQSLFQIAATVCAEYDDFEITINDISEYDKDEEIYFTILSMPISERLNIFSRHFANLDNYPANPAIIDFAGGEQQLKSTLKRIRKSFTLSHSVLPQNIKAELDKYINSIIFSAVIGFILIIGVTLLITGFSHLLGNENNNVISTATTSKITDKPTPVITPTATPKASPTAPPATKTPTEAPTATPDLNQIFVPDKLQFINCNTVFNYVFNNNTLDIKDDNGSLLKTVTYSDKGYKTYEKIYTYAINDALNIELGSSYTEKFYDETGALTHILSHTNKGVLKTEYEYFKPDFPSKITVYDNDILLSETVYSYFYNDAVKEEIKTEYFYDQTGGDKKEISYTKYKSKGDVYSRSKKVIRDGFDYEKEMYNYRYEYNKNGILEKQYGTYNITGSDDLPKYREIVYDSSNNIIKQHIEGQLFDSSYYFDNSNNLILQLRQEKENGATDIYVYNKPLNGTDKTTVFKDCLYRNNVPLSPSVFYLNKNNCPILKKPVADADYVYDNKGNLLIYSYVEEGLKYVVSCKYNLNGLLESENVTIFSDGTFYDSYDVNYYYDNSVLQSLECMGNKYYYTGSNITKIETSDNVTITFEYTDNKLTEKILKYDNVTLCFEFNGKEFMLSTIKADNMLMYFNAQKKLVKTEKFTFNGSMHSVTEYLFNDLNLVTEELNKDANGLLNSKKTYKYINGNTPEYFVLENYDINGNVTSATKENVTAAVNRFDTKYNNVCLTELSGYDANGTQYNLQFVLSDIESELYKSYSVFTAEDLLPK